MKIAIAPNAFKGTLTALDAGRCMERGLTRALPKVKTVIVPMADGGDGTVLAITEATKGRLLKSEVRDPLGRKVKATWGVTGDGKTAIIEMATASGLALLAPKERNPLVTSARGTGELMRAALDRGVTKILIGIGGSATNEGGTTMARVMGYRFLDSSGKELPEGGAYLSRLSRIDASNCDPRLKRIAIEVACDVNNPLTGPRGAAHVYGLQKGATLAMVKQLDAGLKHLAKIMRRDLDMDVEQVPGSGAAGGMGGGLMAFAGGKLRPGTDIVVDAVHLEKRLKGCDLVITGEGRMDVQTAQGKAPAGVGRVAKKLGIPAIAICGAMGPNTIGHLPDGIVACFSALEELMEEGDLAGRAPAMLENCAFQVGRILALGGKL